MMDVHRKEHYTENISGHVFFLPAQEKAYKMLLLETATIYCQALC